MREDLLVRFKLLGAISFTGAAMLLPTGCTSTLDFDAVSSGQSSGDSFDREAAEAFTCAALSPEAELCDDFDGAEPFEPWSESIESPNEDDAQIISDGNGALSGNRSFLAIVNSGVEGDYVAACLAQPLDSIEEDLPYIVDVTFEMRIEQIDDRKDRYATVFQFKGEEGVGEGLNQLVLSLVSRGTDVSSRFRENWTIGKNESGKDQDSATIDSSFKSAPAKNEWAHVHFHLDASDPGGDGNHVRLSVDDTELYDKDLEVDLAKGGPRIELGLPWVDGSEGPTQKWAVRFENIVVRVEQKDS
jgi:hypothetical protein